MTIPLTIVVPNRNRMCPLSKGTEYFFESLKRQSNTNFKLMIIDGGSTNYGHLRSYVGKFHIPNLHIFQRIIQGKFHKTLLNNIAIRKATTPYVMTTDADILFAKDFVDTVIKNLSPEEFIESRTFYLKPGVTQRIHNGELNPFINLDACKIGRIKKRTTPGGCQCGHKDIWGKVRGYDERYLGWGSEDVDLLARVTKAGYKVKWLGESSESIMVFHQHHSKIDIAEDMRDQNRNLTYYNNIKAYAANPEGWGDISDKIGEK